MIRTPSVIADIFSSITGEEEEAVSVPLRLMRTYLDIANPWDERLVSTFILYSLWYL